MSDRDLHVLDGRTAGFVTRLFAFVTDVAIVAGIVALGGWIAVLIDGVLADLGVDLKATLSAIYIFCVPFIIGSYFVMFWTLTGRTIGKWFLGLRVVRADGRPPNLGRAIIRFIGYGISAIVFWMGYIWVAVDDSRRAWHDHMARTWVVYDYTRERGHAMLEEYLADSDRG